MYTHNRKNAHTQREKIRTLTVKQMLTRWNRYTCTTEQIRTSTTELMHTHCKNKHTHSGTNTLIYNEIKNTKRSEFAQWNKCIHAHWNKFTRTMEQVHIHIVEQKGMHSGTDVHMHSSSEIELSVKMQTR